MPKITSAPRVAPKSIADRLPPVSVGVELSKKLDKAIVDPDSVKAKQLKFTTSKGFVAPGSGNPLQVVYLAKTGAKQGLSIAYVDTKANQFWAQAPGVSGLAKGPFKLPAIERDLAKVTKKATAEVETPKRPSGVVSEFDERPRRVNGGSGAETRPSNHWNGRRGSSGGSGSGGLGWVTRGGGGSGGSYGGGSYGGGGGGGS